MPGPLGSKIMSILRVLTPDEIDRYIEEVNTKSELALKVAVGAEDFEAMPLGIDDKALIKKAAEKASLKTTNDERDQISKAKIIPINKSVEDHLNKKRLESNKKKVGKKKATQKKPKGGLESVGILSAEKLKEESKKRQDDEESEKESTSIFILNQKEILKSSQDKLAAQDGILLYRRSAAQETGSANSENTEDKNLQAFGSCGILINKKHY